MNNNLTARSLFIYLLCLVLCAASLMPFWIMIVNATRSTEQIQQSFSLIPSHYLLTNWDVLVGKGFNVITGFLNSAFIAFSSALLTIYFSAMTAYGFVTYRFKGNRFLFAVVLGIIMIPGQLGMIGFYQFMLRLNLTDSFIPLIVPAISTATAVFFFKQYLDATLQPEIIQAARMDGASELAIFHRINLPLMKPALATIAIFSVVGSWNNYLMPLILINSQEKYTLPMMVQLLKTDIYRTELGSMYLGIMLTVLPLLIVYFSLSKYIISGVALGGVKE
ncbi:carbohydrate ABC transporter permease [Paenibacillus paeoniae]|uniref:Carbohydrate ABC transporter permease n=1 Tax=Paenibacillus paeoniae TaxID=2292705 RepID=A0A371PGQ4_9BACL|nr:carbohydrate ABC transporter permease [Paenibacillus paeoniae]REK75133.1 carbohydrate ABC transporter permease [Paenibacillus paeoniae]